MFMVRRGPGKYKNQRIFSKACLSGRSGSVSLKRDLNSNALLLLVPPCEAQKGQDFNYNQLRGVSGPCRWGQLEDWMVSRAVQPRARTADLGSAGGRSLRHLREGLCSFRVKGWGRPVVRGARSPSSGLGSSPAQGKMELGCGDIPRGPGFHWETLPPTPQH